MAKVTLAAFLLLVIACNAPEFPRYRPDEGAPGFRAEDGEIFDAVLPAYPVNMRILDRAMRLLAYTNAHRDPIELRPPLAAPDEIKRDFMDRNQVRHSLSDYHPRQLHLERTDKPELPLLSLTLPGYSRDHDAAIVEVSISTTGMSGGGELLYLKKISGQWRVIAKQRTWIS